MSFFLDFKAKNAADAKKLIDESSLPPTVRAFIETALQNASDEERAGPWHIRADGHLVEQPQSTSGSSCPSSAEINVTPIFFTKPWVYQVKERLEAELSAERKRSQPPGIGSQAVSISAGERR